MGSPLLPLFGPPGAADVPPRRAALREDASHAGQPTQHGRGALRFAADAERDGYLDRSIRGGKRRVERSQVPLDGRLRAVFAHPLARGGAERERPSSLHPSGPARLGAGQRWLFLHPSPLCVQEKRYAST